MHSDADSESTRTIPLSSFDTDVGPGPPRRRIRIAVVAAIAAAAALAAVGAVVAWSGGNRSPGAAPAATLSATGLPALDLAAARPAEEVWPDALVRLPHLLPDGRPFTPKARLGDDRFVGIPHRANAYEAPVVYDVSGREVDELFSDLSESDTAISLPVISVSERVIVVAVAAEVWVAPRSGGSARRRAEFGRDAEVRPFAVGDAVYAAVTRKQERNTTVYRLSAGESPEEVAKAEGTVPHSPYGRWFMTGPPTDSPDALPSAPATFVDVVTGESRTTKALDGLTDIVCSPETCVGHDDTGVVAYRFDGTNPTRVKGEISRKYPPIITETGRFIRLQSRMDEYLWDREKGVVVNVNGVQSGVGPLQECRYSDDEQIMIDLSRVP